ncbi:tetratricopeptide repeat protein [Candidatus Acetothermia bacterium]|nr:tetratricopeptide repeat protein [Candidatus Acetothermia bacterium]
MQPADDRTLKIQLFGRFELWREGISVPPGTWPRAKTQALLKLLLYERGRVFSQDQLIDALFADLDPDKAAHNLHARLSELRRMLEPHLKKGTDSQFILNVGQQGYCFSKEVSCWVDTETFQEQIEAAQEAERTGHWAEALASYKQAIDLYLGDYLAEDLYEEWTISPREHWRELYLVALGRLSECQARLGHYDQAIEQCKKVTQLSPGRESIYRQQMLYHFLAGEHSESFKAYQACVQALQEQLEVDPSPETKERYEQIVKGKVEGVEGIYPKPFVAIAVRHNLPSALTSFVGREKEIAEVKQLLSGSRLVTLTGVGGCGKTRLALRVAGDLVDEHQDGIWLVELATLTNPELVTHAVATVLGVREEPKRPLLGTLTDYLKPKQLLVILDNCEHLLTACAQLVETLLRQCPQLKILASSREGLNIGGELTYHVLSLSLPAGQSLPSLEHLMQYDALRLFVERATFSQPEFRLTEGSAAVAAQICQRLDGIPLAIELAAARVKVLTVEQIVARLDDRFRLLTGGSRTALPRQQTLQQAMDWSWEPLSEQERAVLRRLAVFAGGCTLEAAEAICSGQGIEKSEVLDLLTHLVEKSLAMVQASEGGARYRMLETTRLYGRDKLLEAGESEIVRSQHLNFFLQLAERAEPNFFGPDLKIWLDRVAIEHDNIRSALEWSIISRDSLGAGLQLAGLLWRFWAVRGHATEGRKWLEALLAQSDGLPASVRYFAFHTAGNLASDQGEHRRARDFYEKCLILCQEIGHRLMAAHMYNNLGNIADDEEDYDRAEPLYEKALAEYREIGKAWNIATPLSNLGWIAQRKGIYHRAKSLYEESLVLCRQAGDKERIALVLNNLGSLAHDQTYYDQAKALYNEALTLRQEVGDKEGIASSLNNLGNLARRLGNYSQAKPLHEQALALGRELGSPLIKASAFHNLGIVAQCQADYRRARSWYEESLEISREMRNRQMISSAIEAFASVELAEGRAQQRAVQLFGAAESLRVAASSPMSPADRAEYDPILAAARTALGEDVFAAAQAEGRAMTLEQAVAYALGEVSELPD